MARRRTHPLQVAAEACLGLCVSFAALALGGAPEWTLWPIAALGWSASGLWVAGALRAQRRARWHPVLWIPAGALCLCLLQLVPLPPPVLQLLSPAAAELREFALVPLGLDGWRPISIEPSGTWREVAKHATYLSLLFVALQLGRSVRARTRLLAMVAAVGAAVAMIGLVHRMLGVDALFGAYHYTAPMSLLTTIGNRNHAAAFLTVTGVVAVGLAVSRDDRRHAIAWGMVGLTIGFSTLLTLSRGGIAFFLVGQVLLGLLVVARRGGGWRGAAPVAVAVAAVALAGYLSADQLLERMASVDSVSKVRQSKVELWPMFGEAVAAYSRVGMGRGAFEVAFTRFQTEQPGVTFTHPENLGLQLASEFGVLAAALLAALALGCGIRLLGRDKLGAMEFAAISAVVAVLLHDLFDFSLELPATALAATVAAGAAFSVAAERAAVLSAARAAIGVALLLACLLAAVKGGRSTIAEDERSLGKLIEQASAPAAVRSEVISRIDRHPGDYVFYSVMANVSEAHGEARESLAWVNRVLFLRPIDPAAHTSAGRALLRLGQRTQALLEFHLACTGHDLSALPLAVHSARSVDELERLAGEDSALLIDVSSNLRNQQREADADALLARRLASGAPLNIVLHVAELRAARGDHVGALALLEGAAAQAPDLPELVARTAVELEALGRVEDAITALQAASVRWPESPQVGSTLVRLQLAAGRPAKAREVVARLLPFAADVHARAALLSQQGLTYEAEGRPALALKEWRTVAQLEPQIAAHQYRIALLQERLGHFNEARGSVRRGMAADSPEGAAVQKPWLERLDHAVEARSAAGGREGAVPAEDEGPSKP